MYNGSSLTWYCFAEALPPSFIADMVVHKWIMIVMTVLYGLLAISWLASLLISGDTKATVLHVILGMVALFSSFGALISVQALTYAGIPVTFFFKSVSEAMLLLCLLMTSNGHSITRSGWTLNKNQCFAMVSCLGYFGFDLAVTSLWQLSKVKGQQPRQLFFQHFMELLGIYVFSVVVLSLSKSITCQTVGQSASDIITEIEFSLTFLLVAFLMLMLRPSRMQQIGFTSFLPLLNEKENSI
ncbi:hypothetical protein BSL78_00383 [Apostichopus japonicus]|uniref:Uncharacterized protein n=1 Tax=Stichopus japonicus TaxID=307972 RepID=A0A2G8LR11_STIJA|nr:hypothetical protein BSL78_00383 [Apostichopus japonicus]